jgi:hypothetical protein
VGGIREECSRQKGKDGVVGKHHRPSVPLLSFPSSFLPSFLPSFLCLGKLSWCAITPGNGKVVVKSLRVFFFFDAHLPSEPFYLALVPNHSFLFGSLKSPCSIVVGQEEDRAFPTVTVLTTILRRQVQKDHSLIN